MANGDEFILGLPEDQGPGSRPCCSLRFLQLRLVGYDIPIPLTSSYVRVPGPATSAVDLTDDLTHKVGAGQLDYYLSMEISGIVYTCGLGFLDLGHMRDNLDLTLFYYRWLTQKGRNTAGDRFPTYNMGGEVTIRQDVPPESRIAVARSIAYDQSLAYEIKTYWGTGSGQHTSAFSPEDLVSNFAGTYLAQRVLEAIADGRSTGDVDAEATVQLSSFLQDVQPAAKNDTLFAIGILLGPRRRWLLPQLTGQDRVQKRNFDIRPISPWRLEQEMPACQGVALPVDWENDFPAGVRDHYELRVELGDAAGGFPGLGRAQLVLPDDVPELLNQIKADARQRYGDRFDQPLDQP